MKMMAVLITFCWIITFSFLLTNCTADSVLHSHQEVQASHELADDHQFAFPALPRKLMLKEKVEGNGDKGLVSYKEQKDVLSGGSHKKGEGEEQMVMHTTAAKGTRQEWIEGSDPTHFFTMDYSHVRRRRPIHNKSFPTTTP